jgi:hypothetical protein
MLIYKSLLIYKNMKFKIIDILQPFIQKFSKTISMSVLFFGRRILLCKQQNRYNHLFLKIGAAKSAFAALFPSKSSFSGTHFSFSPIWQAINPI